MPVVCSENHNLAAVDDLEGTSVIRVVKDEHGAHHYIPIEWVIDVDDKVHLDRPEDEVLREWTTTPPGPDLAEPDPVSLSYL